MMIIMIKSFDCIYLDFKLNTLSTFLISAEYTRRVYWMKWLFFYHHSVTQSLILSLTLSLTHSLTHSLTRSPTHSLTLSFTHSLSHLLIHSLTHPLTHSQGFYRIIKNNYLDKVDMDWRCRSNFYKMKEPLLILSDYVHNEVWKKE